MSKHLKALAKLCAAPTPASVRWDELRTVLEHFGYEVKHGSGSRRKFFHKQKNLLIICHEPHPSPGVDKGCVADVVAHLRANGFIEEK